MPKFFLPPEEIHESFMTLTGENYNHAKVLRLKNGDGVTVSDGLGTDYQCTVSDMSDGLISLVVHSSTAARAESAVACRIYMAFAKADKFEHVVQKATELGASEVVAFPTERCVSRPDPKSLEKSWTDGRKSPPPPPPRAAGAGSRRCGPLPSLWGPL